MVGIFKKLKGTGMKKHKYNIDCPCQKCEEQWRKETRKKFQEVDDMNKKRKGVEMPIIYKFHY